MTPRRTYEPVANEPFPQRSATDRRLVLVTADPWLREEVERLCVAVEQVPEVIDDPEIVRHRWAHADCVLLGADVVERVVTTRLPARAGLVVVTRSAQLATWRAAVEIRAEAVVELPVERARLSDVLVEMIGPSRDGGAPARLVCLIGARGGVGTSTTAATIGLVAAAELGPVVLVDADADSAGLDLLLGCESVTGLRWSDLAGVNGRVGAEALLSALPAISGTAVLTWAAEGPRVLPDGTLGTIVAAARRASELVVVDLGRRLGAEGDVVVGQADAVLLVAGGDLMSAAGARRLAAHLRPRCTDLRLVVREGSNRGVDPQLLGAAVELPVALTLRHRRRTERAVDDGLGPPVLRGEARVIRRLLEQLREGATG